MCENSWNSFLDRENKEEMDEECVRLCDALNAMPGVRTFDSCCGHGEIHYYICLELRTTISVIWVSQWFDRGSAFGGEWDMMLELNFPPNMRGTDVSVYFVIRGPIGKRAYEDANDLADRINEFNDMNTWMISLPKKNVRPKGPKIVCPLKLETEKLNVPGTLAKNWWVLQAETGFVLGPALYSHQVDAVSVSNDYFEVFGNRPALVWPNFFDDEKDQDRDQPHCNVELSVLKDTERNHDLAANIGRRGGFKRPSEPSRAALGDKMTPLKSSVLT